MNIFELAYKQLEREGLLNKPNVINYLLQRAIKIRNYLDLYNNIECKQLKEINYPINHFINKRAIQKSYLNKKY